MNERVSNEVVHLVIAEAIRRVAVGDEMLEQVCRDLLDTRDALDKVASAGIFLLHAYEEVEGPRGILPLIPQGIERMRHALAAARAAGEGGEK